MNGVRVGVVLIASMMVLIGCSTDVAGTATASGEVAQASSAPSATTTTTTTVVPEPVDFDPCDLPAALLEELDLTGVIPTPTTGSDGCIWGTDRFGLNVMRFVDAGSLPDPATSEWVSGLETLTDGGYVTYLFIIDEDTYTTQTMTRDGAIVLQATVIGSDSMEFERESLVNTFRVVLPYLPPPR